MPLNLRCVITRLITRLEYQFILIESKRVDIQHKK